MCQCCEWMELYLYSPLMSSWRGHGQLCSYHACYMFHSSHPHWYDNSFNKWRRALIIKLLATHFYPFSFSLIPLFPNVTLSVQDSQFSIPVQHLTHPNKQTGKAEVNLTKPVVFCAQQLNVYCYLRFCDSVLSSGCVSYQYSATHCLHLLPCKRRTSRRCYLPDYTVSPHRRLQQESLLQRRPQNSILYDGDEKWTYCVIMHTLYKPDRL